jgi:hypothetical protein
MLALGAKTRPDEAEAEGFDCSKLRLTTKNGMVFRRKTSLLSAELGDGAKALVAT